MAGQAQGAFGFLLDPALIDEGQVSGILKRKRRVGEGNDGV